MKHQFLTLTVSLLGAATFLTPLANSATRVNIGIGVGVGYGGWGYNHWRAPYYYRHGYGYPYYYGGYYGPTVIYTNPTVVYETPATTTTTTRTITTTASTSPSAPAPQTSAPLTVKSSPPPYGIPENDFQVKSPFSNFIISDTGLKPGTVIYDTYTGQPFRIP